MHSGHHHQHTTRMTLDVPAMEHRRLKAMAGMMGVTMRELVLGCVRENLLYSENRPNAETLRAFTETDKKENLVYVEGLDELMEQLGIDGE